MTSVALYARVSKGSDQTVDNQLFALRNWAKANPQFQVEGEYVDEISSRKTRPQKELVMEKLRKGEIKGVVFVRIDRWGRSTSELAFFFEEAMARNWTVISLKGEIDLSSPSGRLLAGISSVFAQFERDLIRERTKEGLMERKARGIILGRPKGAKDKRKRKKKSPPVLIQSSPYGSKGNF